MTAAREAALRTAAGPRDNSLALIDCYVNGLEDTKIDFTKFKDDRLRGCWKF